MIDHHPMPETDPALPERDTSVPEPAPAAPSQPPPGGKSPLPDTLFDRLDHWVERYIKDHPETRAGL